MRSREFIGKARSPDLAHPCYLMRKSLQRFDRTRDEVNFNALTGLSDDNAFTSIWVGFSGTKTSFQYDLSDNLLA